MGLVKESSGTVHRGLRLGKLGLSLTGSYLGYQVQNLFLSEKKRDQRRRQFQTQSSRRMRAELGSLKGAAMKLGQLLSLQTQALPEEYAGLATALLLGDGAALNRDDWDRYIRTGVIHVLAISGQLSEFSTCFDQPLR